MTISEKTYKTADLYFAAFLKAADVPFLETERDGKRVMFIFEDTGFIGEMRSQYFNRTAKVSALTYADEIRTMKSLTHM